MRNELFQQIFGEFRKLVFELELDPCGQESSSLQQSSDQWVYTVIQDTAEAFRNARIFFSELTRLLIEH